MAAESVDLIYADPPFNTGRDFGAFEDRWHGAQLEDPVPHPTVQTYLTVLGTFQDLGLLAYLTFMTKRLLEMHRLLKPTGSLYLHVDPRTSPYLRTLMDIIFEAKHFQNEIAWCYRGMPSKARRFQAKHDTILLYSKTDRHVFNVLRGEVSETTAEAMPGLVRSGYRANHSKNMVTVYDRPKYERAVAAGKLPEGMAEQEYTGLGPPLTDWWTDIRSVIGWAAERNGYPTQKPVALLERIIQTSSRPGDLVLDPFCGSGTTLVAAETLGRDWIGLDIGTEAIEMTRQRLATMGIAL